MPMEFINVDLEITSAHSLVPIRDAFAAYGDRVFELYCGSVSEEPPQFLASFEVHPFAGQPEVEGQPYREETSLEKLEFFFEMIEVLEGPARACWVSAEKRVLDFGYLSANLCPAFQDAIPARLLQRMAALDIDLVLTIYPKTIRNPKQKGDIKIG